MPYGSIAPGSPVKEDKEAEQRHQTKSKDIAEALQTNEASEAMLSISMDVDSAPPDTKRDKEEGKGKGRATAVEFSQGAVSGSSTTGANKRTKKRKGPEAGQEAAEGKKLKKLKTKAV